LPRLPHSPTYTPFHFTGAGQARPLLPCHASFSAPSLPPPLLLPIQHTFFLVVHFWGHGHSFIWHFPHHTPSWAPPSLNYHTAAPTLPYMQPLHYTLLHVVHREGSERYYGAHRLPYATFCYTHCRTTARLDLTSPLFFSPGTNFVAQDYLALLPSPSPAPELSFRYHRLKILMGRAF